MKRISLEALLRTMQDQSYQEQYEYIRKLLEEEKIKPVKASRTNGKSLHFIGNIGFWKRRRITASI